MRYTQLYICNIHIFWHWQVSWKATLGQLKAACACCRRARLRRRVTQVMRGAA